MPRRPRLRFRRPLPLGAWLRRRLPWRTRMPSARRRPVTDVNPIDDYRRDLEMSETTPPPAATELRAAAQRLRALATAASTATATPVGKGGAPTTHWHFTERAPGSGYLYAANPDGPGTRLIHGGAGRGTYPHMRARHGEYAAAMDPAVGLALAAWLVSAAEDAEQIGADPHALAVAQAIGGEPR